jgi:hypothetical protein
MCKMKGKKTAMVCGAAGEIGGKGRSHSQVEFRSGLTTFLSPVAWNSDLAMRCHSREKRAKFPGLIGDMATRQVEDGEEGDKDLAISDLGKLGQLKNSRV